MNTEIIDEKNALRRRVWKRLDEAGVGRTGPVSGKIPNFTGAGEAASRLSEHPRWRRSRVVKANPDKAQHEVRTVAINEGKLLYMAVPKMAGADPFYLVDPQELDGVNPESAVTGRGAAAHAPRTPPERMRPVDVIVCGSVAVNTDGVRIGKGAGYSDIEMALLAHAGLVTGEAPPARRTHLHRNHQGLRPDRVRHHHTQPDHHRVDLERGHRPRRRQTLHGQGHDGGRSRQHKPKNEVKHGKIGRVLVDNWKAGTKFLLRRYKPDNADANDRCHFPADPKRSGCAARQTRCRR